MSWKLSDVAEILVYRTYDGASKYVSDFGGLTELLGVITKSPYRRRMPEYKLLRMTFVSNTVEKRTTEERNN